MIKDLWKNYRRYLKYSKKESRLAIFFGIFGAFSETLSIYVLANLISNMTDKNISNKLLLFQSFNLSIGICLLIFFTTGILSASLYYLSNKNVVKAKTKIERFVRDEITSLTLEIKWEYFLKLSQGDISKSIIAEGQNISEGFMYFISAINYSFIAFIYFITCLVLVPQSFFILLIYAIFVFRIYIFYSKKADRFGNRLSEMTTNIGIWSASIFNNLKYLRSISKDLLAKEELKNIFLKFAKSYENAMVASYKSKFINEILTIIFIFLSVSYILMTEASSSTLILSLSLFIRMTPKIYNSQSRFLDSLAMVSWPRLHNEKMLWARSFKEFKNSENKFKSFTNGDIVFNSVTFNYPNSEKLLNNLNLQIKENECLGIIGKSGSGKSTFLDLITGIIKPQKGEILISGININDINKKLWRDSIGIVLQENFFKNDTLASNIALGELYINRERIKNCLIQANAYEFVRTLPKGIDELIYDRGQRLSGGEKQKLALARALYNNPKILILDEPASGLDQVSELEFVSTIKKLIGEMLIILISHKKEIVRICDRVLILEDCKLKDYNQ